MLIQTENNNLYRDLSSKAIIVADTKAKEEYKKKIKEKKELQELKDDIVELKNYITEINTLKDEISEIKQMLLSLTNKVN